MINIETKESAKSIGVVNLILALHRVASQLNTFTPEGRAIIIVETIKNRSIVTPIPLTNI